MRSRIHGQLALLSISLALAGCSRSSFLTLDGQALREYDDCIDHRPAKVPAGEYGDRGIAIDYQRLVPLPDPRENVDVDYFAETVTNPDRVEQVYHDATHGDQRAALLVCMSEAGIRGYGRGAARYLASITCQTVSHCLADFDRLGLSRHTTSGKRLRAMFAREFENEGRKQQLTQDLVANGLALVAAGTVAMGFRAVSPARARGRSGFGRSTVGAAEAPVPRFTRAMKSRAIIIAQGDKIDKIHKLVKMFGGKAKKWKKMKTWDASGNEIHWYEHPGIGKVGVKWAGFPDPF